MRKFDENYAVKLFVYISYEKYLEFYSLIRIFAYRNQ